MSDCERIGRQKWATVSESLTKNEKISKSLIFLNELLIRSFFAKNERFAKKTKEQIPNPGNHK